MKNLFLAFSRGTWFAREVYRDVQTGKRRESWRSLGVQGKENKRKAEKVFRALQIELERQHAPVEAISTERFVTQYLESVRPNIRPDTFRSYALWLPKFGAMFPAVPLHGLTPQHVEKFKSALVRERYAPASVNIALRTLRAALRFGVSHGYLERSPADAVRMADVPSHDFPLYWTTEQFDRFMSGIEDARHRACFALCFYAGMRIRETVQLQWEDVTEDRIVIASRAEARTKGDRSRVVPVLGPLREYLTALPRRSRYVLAGKNHVADHRALSKAFTKYVREFRAVDPSLPLITIHKLRHSFATALAPLITLPVLQKILGHAQISTTMIYTHVQGDDALDVVRKAKPFG